MLEEEESVAPNSTWSYEGGFRWGDRCHWHLGQETTQEATELPKRDGGHSHVCGGDLRPGMNPGGPC